MAGGDSVTDRTYFLYFAQIFLPFVRNDLESKNNKKSKSTRSDHLSANGGIPPARAECKRGSPRPRGQRKDFSGYLSRPTDICRIDTHIDTPHFSHVVFSARALSTLLSTAALDKHPQSAERGITLDLGFSAFVVDLPPHLHSLPYDKLQVTLVDCPGHASLIRTIIGGAQIIDLMLLVVDAVKGVQTQTAEVRGGQEKIKTVCWCLSLG